MNTGHDRESESLDVTSGVDVLSDVLRAVRLTGSMLFLVDATTPWVAWAPQAEAFRRVVLPQADHLISYHVITRGACWAGLVGGASERFEAGDVLVVPHGDAYFLADSEGAERTYGADQAVDFFRRMAAGELPSIVNEGGEGPGRTHFICGFLGCDRRPLNPALSALPRMLHVRAHPASDDRLRPLIDFACAELHAQRSGTQTVLLRLAELMFIEVVRGHVESLSGESSGWLAGLRDPLVARALARLHAAPARDWTLDTLAGLTASSRSVLAERFARFVGQPPMQYLAQWRLQLALRLLAEPGAKVATVAEAVGYRSEAAFSRAFKRSVGVAPALWRHGGTQAKQAARALGSAQHGP